ncbi:MAG: chemotaxis response regulator protein-glutamate methylesterase [Candidatus Muirbacterium halophilum]|nr:chemotaxis response regulator protein-glutamate methylesterase [Candidatus Muirbacterium halophilum]MCK9476203.1 chemotaxis response regulator protein-glutamate methylesterase [Candidatus Muirbacterium halophilum]
MIKVIVVDDSALMRKFLSEILSTDNDIKVINTARDGIDALEKIKIEKPDVITLDIEMPNMNGMETLKAIKKNYPKIQVVMISSLTTEHAQITIKALEFGAFDFIPKPSGRSIDINIKKSTEEIISKVKNANYSKSKIIIKNPIFALTKLEKKEEYSEKILKNNHLNKIIAIGISTGGPNAIMEVLPKLPQDLKACILIVQHMPAGFTKAFAERLNSVSKLYVKEAENNDVCSDGKVFLAPGNYHLKVRRQGVNLIIDIAQDDPVNRHRPSADVLFESVAKNYSRNTMGIIMTGMGSDGAKNIGMIKKFGGYTIGQDEKTSIVYGMPRVANELGNLDKVVSLYDIHKEIIDFTNK